MKLVIATPLYPPQGGGPATYSALLEKALPVFEVPVMVKFSDVRRLPKLIRHIAYFLQVHKALKDADMLLVLDPVSTGVPASLAARMRKKPYVVKIVGDYAWEQAVQRFGIAETLDNFNHKKVRNPFVTALCAIEHMVAQHAAHVIVPSNYLKRVVVGWGIKEEKIAVIYNAVDVSKRGTIPKTVTELPRPRIVTVARLVPWKGVRELIDSMEAVSGSLTVVGDGVERVSLEAHAKKLQPRVVFTGELSHEDTLAVIEDADVFVLNSRYEGLPHVVIEALLLSTPVIATDVGGTRELISSPSEGILIAPEDTQALTEALSKVSNLSRPTVAAEQFSVDTMVGKTAALLKTLA